MGGRESVVRGLKELYFSLNYKNVIKSFGRQNAWHLMQSARKKEKEKENNNSNSAF
jgi:hypothetical protein